MGLLDSLNDPELMALLAERSSLAAHVAAQSGITKAQAREWLDMSDREAMEAFFVGNSIDRKFLH